MFRLRRRLGVTVVALVCAFTVLPATTASADEIGTVSATTAANKLRLGMTSTMTPNAARTALGGLTVKAAGTMTGYSRDLFPHWRDASSYGWPTEPNNACNARNAALYRDGANVQMSSTCTSLTGTWVDPYSAKKFDEASDIDIDHMVPLANAWRSGAASWTTDKRTKFANDPLVLVSVLDSLNQSKGDKGPEAWKPPLAQSHCLYAVRWTFVKKAYAMSVTSAEKSALTSMLGTC